MSNNNNSINSNFKELDFITLFNTSLGITNFIKNSIQISNDDIMKELTERVELLIKKAIKQNNIIIEQNNIIIEMLRKE